MRSTHLWTPSTTLGLSTSVRRIPRSNGQNTYGRVYMRIGYVFTSHFSCPFFRSLIAHWSLSAQDQPRGAWRVLRALHFFPQGNNAGWGRWRAFQARVNETYWLWIPGASSVSSFLLAKAGYISRVEFAFRVSSSPDSRTLIFRLSSKTDRALFSSFILYIRDTHQNGLCRYLHFSCIASSFRYSIGESLSLMPPTLIAPEVGFVLCCIYSTVAVPFFLGSTVDMHTPCVLSIFPSPRFRIV